MSDTALLYLWMVDRQLLTGPARHPKSDDVVDLTPAGRAAARDVCTALGHNPDTITPHEAAALMFRLARVNRMMA